jgi:hypothetical protein
MFNFSSVNNIILAKLNFVFFIFLLTSLAYNNDINAFDKTNIDNFQNSSSQDIKHNNDSRIINYPNSNITNLTNNNEDSIYGQIESLENNIYVVWQESVTESLPEHNYDIFFVKSEDNGKTFSKAINISNNSKNSTNQEISAFDENVYIVWQESGKNKIDENIDNNIIFTRSMDSGNTFKNSIDLINNSIKAFPKINSFGNNVYIVWNNEDKNNNGLFLVKSPDKGNNFDKIIKINADNNFGESQISVDKNEVLISWGGLLTKNIDNVYYVKSNDNGYTFSDSNTFSKKITSFNDTRNLNELDNIIKNPLNVEVTSNNNLSSVAWQNSFSKQNEDILILLLSNQKEQNNYARLLNLSNNPSVSECPSITISNNNIYVIWEDYISGNHEILFAKISTGL